MRITKSSSLDYGDIKIELTDREAQMIFNVLRKKLEVKPPYTSMEDFNLVFDIMEILATLSNYSDKGMRFRLERLGRKYRENIDEEIEKMKEEIQRELEDIPGIIYVDPAKRLDE
jgi:hypothetical protein